MLNAFMAHVVSHGEQTPFGPNSALVFLHIPKCGGTTLAEILKCNFQHNYWRFYTERNWWHSLQALQTAPCPMAISGHRIWGIHEPLREDLRVFYCTMLRHPLALRKSQYAYRGKRNRLVSSLAEFLINVPANGLLRWLGNSSLQLAKERLEGLFHCFGLVEYYDLSAVIFARTYGLSLEGAAMRNVTDSAALECPQSVVDYFLEKNAQDLELYEWAKALFIQRYNLDQQSEQHEPSPQDAPLIVRTGESEVQEPKGVAEQLKVEDYDQAIVRLEDLLRTSQRRPYFDTLLDLYHQTRQQTKLAALLPRAIQRFPGYSSQYIAKFHRYLDDTTLETFLREEVALAEQFVSTLPDSRVRTFLIETTLMLVRRQWMAGALPEAVRQGWAAFERFSDDARVLNVLGWLLIYTNAPAQALEVLAYTPLLHSDQSTRHEFELLKAEAYAQLGQERQARTHLLRYQQTAPNFHHVLPLAQVVPMSAAVGQKASVLIVEGTSLLLTHVLQQLAPCGGKVDLLVPAYLHPYVSEVPGVERVFLLPYRHIPGVGQDHLDAQLFERRYDALIVVERLETFYTPRSRLLQQLHTQARYLYPHEFFTDEGYCDQLLHLVERT